MLIDNLDRKQIYNFSLILSISTFVLLLFQYHAIFGQVFNNKLLDTIENQTYHWDDILATYIYFYYGKTTRTLLAIEYYDKVDDVFRSTEIDITDLEFSSKSISTYIESYKRLHKNSA